MFRSPSFPRASLLKRGAVAIATLAACAGASAALPTFTFDPAAAGLAGPAFTADNLLISDYATVTTTNGGAGFKETGYLSITAAQLGSTTFNPTGLSSSYGLYIAYTATGTNKEPVGNVSFGDFDTLTYTLLGYNGKGVFSPTSAPVASVTLGSGSLISGTFTGTSSKGKVTSSFANADLSFAMNAAESGFFKSPTPFYSLAEAAFSNTRSEITTTSTGFVVKQGGGSINFVAAAVPEPETYALLLAGLGALGFVARRRKD